MMATETRSEIARTRMIEAAERLVADRGLASVSARDVLQASDQRNKSAIAYHFGSWDGLIAAVLTTRMAVVSTRRREMLDRLDADPTVRDLMEVVVVPIAEHCVSDASSHWARFVYRCMADPSVAGVVNESVEGESFRESSRRVNDALGHLPEALRARRFAAAFSSAIAGLAAFESRRGDDRRPRLPVEVELSDLVDVATAIVERPPSEHTVDLLEATTAVH